MSGFMIGRVRGIDIRVHWSVGIIGWLIAWSLSTQRLPDMVDGHPDSEYWTAGIIATIGFLAALVAHELGHSIVALRHSVSVESITLWMFGGVARLHESPQSPDAAIRIAAAGPLVSVALGVVGLAAAAGSGGLVGAVFMWFGSVNLLLAVFNLLPGFPLDGGRIYQAWLWQRGEDPVAATTKAARLGAGVGRALVWVGVIEIVIASLLSGLWLMAIGWFIREASQAEGSAKRMQSRLRSYTCADVMTPNPESVPADRSIEAFANDVLSRGRHAAYPVVGQDLRTCGLVNFKSIKVIPRTRWSKTPVSAVMIQLVDVPLASSTDSIECLMKQMGEHEDTRALIMDGDQVVGVVSPSDIARLTIAIELADAQNREGRTPRETADR